MQPVLNRLAELETSLAIVGSGSRDSATQKAALRLPVGLPEELSPLAEIIPLQMLARELAVVRGFDPDAPRGLLKVTKTW